MFKDNPCLVSCLILVAHSLSLCTFENIFITNSIRHVLQTN